MNNTHGVIGLASFCFGEKFFHRAYGNERTCSFSLKRFEGATSGNVIARGQMKIIVYYYFRGTATQ